MSRAHLIDEKIFRLTRAISLETGGLFRIAIKLMMAASPEFPPRYSLPYYIVSYDIGADATVYHRDYVPLANLIGIIFQIRDDYVNLQSVQVSHSSPSIPFVSLLKA